MKTKEQIIKELDITTQDMMEFKANKSSDELLAQYWYIIGLEWVLDNR